MKKLLLWSLMVVPANSALCMESKAIQETQTSLSPFYITELRLLITEQLCKQCFLKEALTTIKAWAMTDTKAWAFFQTNESAHAFIDWFYRNSYLNNFPIALLQKLKALVDQKELATFNQSLEKGAELVKLFDSSATQKDWKNSIAQLTSLDKTTLSKYLAHYYWESSYMNSYAQKTLLCYALELQAPQEVIKSLIDWGFRSTFLKVTTPSPCLIVCQNIINTTSEYNKKINPHLRALIPLQKEYKSTLIDTNHRLTTLLFRVKTKVESDVSSFHQASEAPVPLLFTERENEELTRKLKEHTDALEFLEKGYNTVSKDLKDILAILIAKKAGLNSPFYTPNPESPYITALSSAAHADNVELVNYLLENGAQIHPLIFNSLLLEFVRNKLSFFTLETLFSNMSTPNLQSSMRSMINTAARFNQNYDENFCKALTLFLSNKDIDVNAVEEGFTMLDILYLNDRSNSKVCTLLIQHGAVVAEKNENQQTITSLIGAFNDFCRNNRRREETAPFLREIKTLLLDNTTLVVPRDLITKWLKLALDVVFTDPTCSEEGKEFWKFIALRFPHIPPYRVLVSFIRTIKLQLKNDEPTYQLYLKKTHDFISWLIKEGITDTEIPPSYYLAKNYGLDELMSSLAAAVQKPDTTNQ